MPDVSNRTPAPVAPAEPPADESWARQKGHLAPGVTMQAVIWGLLSESKAALLDAALNAVCAPVPSCMHVCHDGTEDFV